MESLTIEQISTRIEEIMSTNPEAPTDFVGDHSKRMTRFCEVFDLLCLYYKKTKKNPIKDIIRIRKIQKLYFSPTDVYGNKFTAAKGTEELWPELIKMGNICSKSDMKERPSNSRYTRRIFEHINI